GLKTSPALSPISRPTIERFSRPRGCRQRRSIVGCEASSSSSRNPSRRLRAGTDACRPAPCPETLTPASAEARRLGGDPFEKNRPPHEFLDRVAPQGA